MYELPEDIGDYALDLPPAIEDKEEDVIVLQELNDDTPFEEGVEVLEQLLNDRDKLLGNMLKLQEMREFGVNETTRQVVIESANFRKYLEKRYLGKTGYSFANEAFFYGGDTRQILVIESEESSNIFVKIWNAIKKAFQWLSDFIGKLFGMTSSTSESVQSKTDSSLEKLEEANKRGQEVRKKALDAGLTNKDIESAIEEAMEEAFRSEYGGESFEQSGHGEIGLKQGSTLSKALYVPGMKAAKPEDIIDYFAYCTGASGLLGAYGASIVKTIQDANGAIYQLLTSPHEDNTELLSAFSKENESTAFLDKFKRVTGSELHAKYNVSGLKEDYENGADGIYFTVGRLPKGMLFGISKVKSFLGNIKDDGSKVGTEVYFTEHFVGKAKEDFSENFTVESLFTESDRQLLATFIKQFNDLTSTTRKAKENFDKLSKKVLSKDVNSLVQALDGEKGDENGRFSALVLRFMADMEKDAATAWRNISRTILEVERYGRSILRYIESSSNIAAKTAVKAEKIVNDKIKEKA